jgi:hypothetical protein
MFVVDVNININIIIFNVVRNLQTLMLLLLFCCCRCHFRSNIAVVAVVGDILLTFHVFGGNVSVNIAVAVLPVVNNTRVVTF